MLILTRRVGETLIIGEWRLCHCFRCTWKSDQDWCKCTEGC